MIDFTILVVDDNAEIRELLRVMLESKGYTVLEAENGMEAIECVKSTPTISLIILDIMMPQIDGIETCHRLRKISAVPILFLTSKSQLNDKTAAYASGGDDYLVKPFSQSELMLKVASLLRRYYVYQGNAKQEESDTIVLDDLVIDPTERSVKKGNTDIVLTDKEFALLMLFLHNRGKTLGAGEIYEAIWNEKSLQSSGNNVTVLVLNLRKKIETDANSPRIIRTVWGKGYQID